MLGIGDRIPDVEVWLGPRERVPLAEVVEASTTLFLFYLFDWSST